MLYLLMPKKPRMPTAIVRADRVEDVPDVLDEYMYYINEDSIDLNNYWPPMALEEKIIDVLFV